VPNEGSAYKMSAQLPPARRRLRFGIVGGGGGGFIGPVHMLAARMDNRYELLAAAPSSRPDVAIEAGREWFLSAERVYTDYRQMAAAEAVRSDGIEVVAIATPNHLHYDAVCAFLDAGINVICDKPLTTTLEQAVDLVRRGRPTIAGYQIQQRPPRQRGMVGRMFVARTDTTSNTNRLPPIE
jgi:predicted dehydrogenase